MAQPREKTKKGRESRERERNETKEKDKDKDQGESTTRSGIHSPSKRGTSQISSHCSGGKLHRKRETWTSQRESETDAIPVFCCRSADAKKQYMAA
eukprot:scaffold77829_cov30-Attheya_sp.AAC.1